MANLQWLPGLQYSIILIARPNTYNSEHQTHIWHYREYFSEQVLANKDYDYIRHTKLEILVTTPNINYNQYLELRKRFIFHPYSFATIDLSGLDKPTHFYKEIITLYMSSNPIYDLYTDIFSIHDIAGFIARNPTYKIHNINQLYDIFGWELNQQIKPETIFNDIKYDADGFVTSVGTRKTMIGNGDLLQHNPNFYCFARYPNPLNITHNLIPPFSLNPANISDNDLGYANSNRLLHIMTKDIHSIHDFIIKPKKQDIIYQYIITGKISFNEYIRYFNHFIRTDSSKWDIIPCDIKHVFQSRKQIYMYTHLDPVKYDIDRL